MSDVQTFFKEICKIPKRCTLIFNVLDRWNLYVRLDGPDPYGHLSRGVRRPPLIGQQGGRRLNTRLSLADHFEYLNLKIDHVPIICPQTYFGDFIAGCCPLEHIKISARSTLVDRSYATFPNFQKVELTKLPPKVNFNVSLSKLYLCALKHSFSRFLLEAEIKDRFFIPHPLIERVSS